MKTILSSCIALLITFSCTNSKKIVGTYYSTCVLYGEPNVVLTLNEDTTFQYERPYVDENVIGKWEVEKGKLILSAEVFKMKDRGEYAPRVKYTKAENEDIYLIRGKKLLRKSEEGFTKDCYMIKGK
ncbi:MAG: hypothetical protein ACFB0B_17495 [Thermonemataceae bacterium]